jgi:hypothetical protein
MKRRFLPIAVLLVLAAMISVILVAVPSPVSAGGLVVNQSFESPLGSEWSVSGSAGQVCTGPVYEGTCAAEITGAGGSLTQWVGNITPKGNYQFWGWVYATSNVYGALEIDYWLIEDGNQTQLTSTAIVPITNTGGNYVEGNITVRAPLFATHARIRLVELGNWSSGHEDVRFDEIGLYAPGCFIATAAYGTDTAKQLDVLRAFRDQVLLKDPLGSRLVSLYYRFSPPAANYISQHNALRTVVRDALVNPIVTLTTVTESIWGR